MKKSGTRTPAKVQAQRDNAAAMKGGGERLRAVLKNLEEEAAKEYEAFEARQREKREKALAEIINPLRQERNDAAQQVNDLNTRISEIDKQIRELTGAKEPKGGGKRRQRKSKEEKAQIAALLYGVLKDSGKPMSAGELENVAAGVAVRELRDIWNEANPGKKINKTGEKSTTRYSA